MIEENVTSIHSHPRQLTNKCVFSIIVPVLNEADQIKTTIEHLYNKNMEGSCEVIIVDGDQQGSTINAIENKSVKAITSQFIALFDHA